MLAFPYAHEDAGVRPPKATFALLGLWCLGFAATTALDAPLQAQRAELCGEATHLVVMHPRLARDAPRWPGCDLPGYVAGPQDLRRRVPTQGGAALRATLQRKAVTADALRRRLSESQFAYDAGAPRWLSPLTSLLLHAGLPAFLAALLGLWLVGPTIELRLKAPALPLLFLVGGTMGVVAAGGAGGRGPILGAGASLAATLAAAVVAAPRGRVRVFWAYWWFRSGRLSVPAVPLAGLAWILATAWPQGGPAASNLALVGPPLILGALVGALSRRPMVKRTAPDVDADRLTLPSGRRRESDVPTVAEAAAQVTAPELPDAPDLLDRPAGAKLVTRRGRTITGETPKVGTPPGKAPRLMLRRARMVSLRDDRAILGVGASVVEQRWDEVRWVASGISGDVGPVLDLITSWHVTPKGPVASGLRVIVAQTDFDALFHLPPDAAPDERYRVLAETVRTLAPHARRLPDDYAFAKPIGYPDEASLDAALAAELHRDAAATEGV